MRSFFHTSVSYVQIYHIKMKNKSLMLEKLTFQNRKTNIGRWNSYELQKGGWINRYGWENKPKKGYNKRETGYGEDERNGYNQRINRKTDHL